MFFPVEFMKLLRTPFLQSTSGGSFCKQRKLFYYLFILSLPAPCISESCIKIKINLHFYFPTSLWRPSRPSETIFEVTQRSVKIKISVNFSLHPGFGRQGLNFWTVLWLQIKLQIILWEHIIFICMNK